MDMLINKLAIVLLFIFMAGASASFSQISNGRASLAQKKAQVNKQGREKVAKVKSGSRWLSYSLVLGRKRKDFNSARKYTFRLPNYMKYRLTGEDASSGHINFVKNNEVVFSVTGTDYVLGKDYVKASYPGAYAISFAGGHTNILRVFKSNLKELEGFIKYFKIDGRQVFKLRAEP